MMEIQGNRVWALRRALGISAPELARRARVSRDALHRIERGLLTGEPLVSTMERLAQALELGRLSDVYVIEGDGGLLGALERRRPRKPERRPLSSPEALAAAADRWAAVTAPLPEPERLLIAELADRASPDSSEGLRSGTRIIRDWLLEHDGAGRVTLGRLRGLARTWVAAAAADVAVSLEQLDAAIADLTRPEVVKAAESEPARPHGRGLLSRGR